MAEDPDPATQSEVRALLLAGDEQALAERFLGRLSFGTAGIRGVLGAGPGRMNRAVARLIAGGIGRVLRQRVPGSAESGVAVGYDARILSREIALELCGVFAALGLRVRLLPQASPTPLLAFAVLELQTAAGVMVTASHNPPEYNGVKVYWHDGAQIVPPLDAEISSSIEAMGSVASVPFLAPDEARGRRLVDEVDSGGLERCYLAAIDRQVPAPSSEHRGEDPSIVYTPLHGVGWHLTRRAFERRGWARISVVAAQAEPDGRFPTTRLPNPEEPPALELALRQARRERAALVLAHDPDGDRIAVAVRAPDGTYQILSGDQVGCLLAYHILDTCRAQGRLPAAGFVATMIVSSSQLGRIAELYGVRCELTLTGLKWIWNRALDLKRQGATFLFGYEEALGYSVGPAVRDKDGISAGLVVAEAARGCAAAGETLLDLLEVIDARAGVSVTRQLSLPLSEEKGRDQVRRLTDRLREDPQALGGLRLERLSDFERSERLDFVRSRSERLDLPSSPVVVLELEQKRTVKLRPSGTEPKLKIYLEATGPPTRRDQVAAAREKARAALDVLEQEVRELL